MASLYLEQGVNTKTVAERLGHASVTITLDLYSHCLPGVQEAAAVQFGTAMKLAKTSSKKATAELFASMALAGRFLDAEQYAKNTIVETMTSATVFRTEWRGETALGVDKGFWTVLIAYERDGQGSFLPLVLGVYER